LAIKKNGFFILVLRSSLFLGILPRRSIDFRQWETPIGRGADQDQKGNIRLYFPEFLFDSYLDGSGKCALAANLLPKTRHGE
jgi:hypothetical protein